MARTRERDDDRVGAAVGAFAAILTSGALAGARDSLGATNVALVLVVVVVLAGASGPVAGASTAFVAAVSFNFFHTRPYRSLRISDGRDIVTVALLLGIGLIVGALAEWRRRASRSSAKHLEGEHSLERVAELLAAGAGSETVASEVCGRLVRDLRLAACRFELRATTDLPVVARTGGLPTEHLRLGDSGVHLPTGGAVVPVGPDGRHGRLVLVPADDSSSTREQRRIAVALADLLTVAIDREPARP